MLQCKGMTRTNLEVFHDVAVQPLESQSNFFLALFLFVWFLFVFAALCLVGLLTYSAGLQPCCYGLFLFLASSYIVMFIRRLPLGPACPLCSTGCIPIQSAELGWAQVLAVNMLAVNLVLWPPTHLR